jgi:hypothetical protein
MLRKDSADLLRDGLVDVEARLDENLIDGIAERTPNFRAS